MSVTQLGGELVTAIPLRSVGCIHHLHLISLTWERTAKLQIFEG